MNARSRDLIVREWESWMVSVLISHFQLFTFAVKRMIEAVKYLESISQGLWVSAAHIRWRMTLDRSRSQETILTYD